MPANTWASDTSTWADPTAGWAAALSVPDVHARSVSTVAGQATSVLDLAQGGVGQLVTLIGDALTGRDTQQVNIIAIGDSLVEMTAANYIYTRWTGVLQDALRDRYPTTGVSEGGAGLIHGYDHTGFQLDDPVRAGTFTAPVNRGFGYRGMYMSSGSSVTYASRACTSIRVWYSTILGSGTLAVTVDGGDPVLIPTTQAGASYTDHWLDIPFGSSASRAVVVDVDSTGSLFFPNPGFTGVQYFDGDDPPGAYASFDGTDGCQTTCPDAAALDVTGDIDLRVRFRTPDSSLAADQFLIAKWDSPADKRSYILALDTTGKLKLYWSTAGTVTLSQAATSMSAVPADTWVWGRVTMDVNDGSGNRVTNFYLETDDTDDHTAVTWGTPVSTHTVSGTTSIHADTTALRVGQTTAGIGWSGNFTGDVRAAAVLDGIAGTVVADPVFSRTSAKVLADSAGNVWTHATSVTQTIEEGGKGIHVINSGKNGAQASTFAAGAVGVSQTATDLVDWFDRIQIAAVILALSGVNEHGNNVDPETFRTNLQTIVDEIRDADATVPILFPIYPTPDWSTPRTYAYSLYNAVTYDIAATTTHSAVVDLTVNWPQPGTDEGDDSGFYYDGVAHLTTAGHAAFAQRLLAAPTVSRPTVAAHATSVLEAA